MIRAMPERKRFFSVDPFPDDDNTIQFYHQFDKIMNLYTHRLASQGSYTYASYVYIVYRHANNNTFALMQNMKKTNKIFENFHNQLSKGADTRWAPSKYIV